MQAVCEFVDIDFREELLPSPAQRLPLGSRYHDRWYPLNEAANSAYEDKVDTVVIEAASYRMKDRAGE